MKDEDVKDAAQGAAEEVPKDAARDLAFIRGPGGARPPHDAITTTAAAAAFVQLALR